jgi:hypothetical protein
LAPAPSTLPAHLQALNAQASLARGYNGSGVKVAVLDSRYHLGQYQSSSLLNMSNIEMSPRIQALSAPHQLDDKQKIGLLVSSTLSIASADITLSGYTARSADGTGFTKSTENYHLGSDPSHDIELFYNLVNSDESYLGLNLIHRIGSSGNTDQPGVALSFGKKYLKRIHYA